MNILMEDLTVKDALSSVIIMHTSFVPPSIDDHDELIGPLGRLFVEMRHGCENVDGMSGIFYVDSYVVGGYFFQMVLCYFLNESSSKSLSFYFDVLFSFLCLLFRFL